MVQSLSECMISLLYHILRFNKIASPLTFSPEVRKSLVGCMCVRFVHTHLKTTHLTFYCVQAIHNKRYSIHWSLFIRFLREWEKDDFLYCLMLVSLAGTDVEMFYPGKSYFATVKSVFGSLLMESCYQAIILPRLGN